MFYNDLRNSVEKLDLTRINIMEQWAILISRPSHLQII